MRQRRTIPISLVVRSVFTLYPRRSILGLALFVGQAFLYNSILFGLGALLSMYFHISTSDVPYYIAIFAIGNLFGPLTLGRLFDSVGRIPMIAGCYILSGVMLIGTAILFDSHSLTATTLIILLSVLFFFASAGVCGAYLTVSEVFPMETRALCIAVFYAIGTGIGGITGPLVFQKLVSSGSYSQTELAFMIGAVMMIIGGVAELIFGVKAEGESLENIARPLTAEDASASGPAQGAKPATAAVG